MRANQLTVMDRRGSTVLSHPFTVRAPMEGKMAEQKKKETRPTKPAEGGGDGATASPEIAKKGKKIKEDIDKLLDEIDDILEENAEEFVKSYVQRGGE
jgi:prokaryotic ubiquitin-like protein Pup